MYTNVSSNECNDYPISVADSMLHHIDMAGATKQQIVEDANDLLDTDPMYPLVIAEAQRSRILQATM